jgi:hypothetical protein
VQYGFEATRTVNLTGGKRVPESEFVDGLRMSVVTEQSPKVKIDLRAAVGELKMLVGMLSLSRWISEEWFWGSELTDDRLVCLSGEYYGAGASCEQCMFRSNFESTM